MDVLRNYLKLSIVHEHIFNTCNFSTLVHQEREYAAGIQNIWGEMWWKIKQIVDIWEESPHMNTSGHSDVKKKIYSVL